MTLAGTTAISPLVTTASLIFPILLLAVILPLTTHSRRGIVFGITLSADFVSSPEVRAAIARYRRALILASVAIMLAIVIAAWLGHMNAAVWISVLGTPYLLVATIVMRVREAKRLRPHAIVAPLTRTADLNPPSAQPSLVASALALLPLAATALWLRTHWLQIPARWPEHWDAAGNVNGWGTRTPGSVMMPLLMGACIALLLLFIGAFMAFAPGAGSRQRNRFLAPLAAMTWLMALLFCVIALSPLTHPDSPAFILIAAGLHVCAMLGVIVWGIARSGFMDKSSTAWTEPSDGTPDAYWHGGGLLYINPSDPAVLVPKRFGFGWTLNLGRPLAKVYLGILFVFLVACMCLPFLLK